MKVAKLQHGVSQRGVSNPRQSRGLYDLVAPQRGLNPIAPIELCPKHPSPSHPFPLFPLPGRLFQNWVGRVADRMLREGA